jgi:hypothetical protein
MANVARSGYVREAIDVLGAAEVFNVPEHPAEY